MLSPCMYWCYPSAVLNSIHSPDAAVFMLSLMLSPTCTDAITLQYCSYPSTVLNSLQTTDAIPHMYCSYPSAVLNSFRSTDAIPSQDWCYPPQYWYYSSTVLMLSPHWCYAPTVLNSLRSTEPTLYGIISERKRIRIPSNQATRTLTSEIRFIDGIISSFP